MGVGSKPASYATFFPIVLHVAFPFIVSACAVPHVGQPICVFLDRPEYSFRNPNATSATVRSFRRRTFPELSCYGGLPAKTGRGFMFIEKVQLDQFPDLENTLLFTSTSAAG